MSEPQDPDGPTMVRVTDPREQRAILLNALTQSGAVVLRADVGPHFIAIVMPPQSEVAEADLVQIYDTMVAALTEALETTRLARATARGVNSTGGSS